MSGAICAKQLSARKMAKPPHNQRGTKPQQVPQENQQTAQQITAVQQQSWSGPLPPPAALEHFNRIIPNGAERILAMVEREQEHRTRYEQKALDATAREARRGQYLGSGLSALALIGAVFTTYIGAPEAVSIALVSLPVLGVIHAIVRRRSRSQDQQ